LENLSSFISLITCSMNIQYIEMQAQQSLKSQPLQKLMEWYILSPDRTSSTPVLGISNSTTS